MGLKIKIISICLGLFCFFLFLSGVLFAVDKNKIIIINTDTSIERYRQIQEEFKKTISYPLKEIDLADKKMNLRTIEKLLDEPPDLVYCIGSRAYYMAREHISEKDILFSSILNWLRFPLSKKTYGISNELHSGMQIILFRYIFPNIQKIGILYSSEYTVQWFDNTVQQAKEVGITIVGKTISDRDVIPVLKNLLTDIDAFWLISDPVLISAKENVIQILKECDRQKKPVFSYLEAFARYGAVLIVSADNMTIGRQAAGIATELLSGNAIPEKVQFPAGTRIILNLKKIKDYGLQYSKDAMDAVNHIIE